MFEEYNNSSTSSSANNGLSHFYSPTYKEKADKLRRTQGITGNRIEGKEIKGWRNNDDGTHTVIAEGATLWDLYGPNWRELSGYEGDPTKLHVGDTVGKKMTGTKSSSSSNTTNNSTSTPSRNPNTQQDHNLKVGLSHVEDYKNTCLKTGNTGITEKKFIGSQFAKTSTGFEIDVKKKIIRTSLTDKRAFANASGELYSYEQSELGYKCVAYREDGSSLTFSKYSEMLEYMDPEKKTVSEVFGSVSTATGLANTVMDTIIEYSDDVAEFTNLPKYSGIASKVSNKTGFLALGLDIKAVGAKPTFKNFSNVINDIVGFASGWGPLASPLLSKFSDLLEGAAQFGIQEEAKELKRQYQIDSLTGAPNMSLFSVNNMSLNNITKSSFLNGLNLFFSGE